MNTVIYNCFDLEYKSPFGAIEQKTECHFSLKLPKGAYISDVVLVVIGPQSKERCIQFEKCEENIEEYIKYSCVYSPNDVGVHYYYFSLNLDGTRRYIKRQGVSVGGFDTGELFQLTVFDKGLTTPDWLKGGVIYQIFPDRFAKSGEVLATKGRNIHEKWDDIPVWWQNEHGEYTSGDYFGGNFKGIMEKLSYLESLGVTCIYFNPVFESHENHRYSTADYSKIDPMLGTEEDFAFLCQKAKEKGIRIILDGVFSHTGADSIYFNKFGRYGENVGAYRDSKSEYRDWYNFTKYPKDYESWWGITTLPNVNETDSTYLEYICGKNGILKKWLDLGAAGWRLDVADELPDLFIDWLHISVREQGQDKIIYGEVWEDASNKESYGIKRRYLIGGQLDSVMNYPFKECILNYIKNSEPTAFVNGIMTIMDHYPKPSIDLLMNFLSTHDIERAITRLAGEDAGWNDRAWQASHSLSNEQYIVGRTLLKCAMVLQFFLPGVPSIYYGDEVGLEGYRDPFNRKTFPWGKEDTELYKFTCELSKIRASNKVFAKGTLKFKEVTKDCCVFIREDKELGEGVLILLNKSRMAKEFFYGDFIDAVPVRGNARTQNNEITVNPFDYEVIKYKFEGSLNV